jgi:prefoldin beta subunit
MPPWLQEQIMKLQQTQQSLQSIMTQKQHLEIEKAETTKALEELKKIADGDAVFKQAGTVLIKSTKQGSIDELEERIEMAKTRTTVLEKQEIRVKDTLKEQEAKITEMMKGGANPPSAPPSSPPPEDNPRK